MPGQRIGYVRVSHLDQNPGRQLEHVAVDRVFTDTASGRDVRRPGLAGLLSFVRDGDTVVVHSMDRLARNLEDLRRLVRTIAERGARVEFVSEGLVFGGQDSPLATLLLSVMGAFAEFERAVIRERQREGIALAKKRGSTGDAKRPCRQARRRLGRRAPPASPRRPWPANSASAGRPSIAICRPIPRRVGTNDRGRPRPHETAPEAMRALHPPGAWRCNARRR